MSELRRMISSSNALFVFEAAARSGSFTRAAEELNVTQPAVSRMLSRFEGFLGVRLFERGGRTAVLTTEGEMLYRRVADGFRSVEIGLKEIKELRGGGEIVTLSVSSAFTTHWMMPRINKLRRDFPTVDLRFQLIPGSLRGPVENVDFGMRFKDASEPSHDAALVMNEVMLPLCSPGYRAADAPEDRDAGDTIITLADTPGNWATGYPGFMTGRQHVGKVLNFSDYAVVVQAALLGQGVALGWVTVASHWLLTGALIPASEALRTTRRVCVLIPPRNRPVRPIAVKIRDWIIDQMRAEVEEIDQLYPQLGLKTACYR